ncbi:mandelate racemase/muconate lactonizing enzyme family protein [Jeotgalibacillus proteolyticus]|uniref:Dipeptide epimerase n=1 Tax=Jeotgalibacillus proteolyticus TaxID=2082395 RepID=A0A2S5GDD6_9BACL|nr:dipeptide epimerase [Jeotgalibacillus proteolyticus]PPA71052.1 dipeptide epimerase [Jeotgalibacillus proteolyticus]
MKITEASIWGIHLPLKEPFVVSYATFPYMPSIILELKTDNGLSGFGEAVPDEHVTGESFEGAYELLKHILIPEVLGESPFNIEHIHQKMNEKLIQNPSIKAAVDIACYDLMGKASGLPIYDLIGGRAHERLTYPKVISIGTPEKMAAQCTRALEEGYKDLKIKLSGDVQADVDRLHAIRKAAGKGVPIRVDVNQGWKTADQAKRALSQFDTLDLDWVEQPLAPHEFEAMNELRSHSSIPLMLDESVVSETDLNRAIVSRAADKINIKLMKCGGIYPAIHMAKTAEAAGLTCQIGSMVESSIGSAAGYHAAMARKNITSTELTGPLLFSCDIGNLNYQIPEAVLNDQPGLGINIDRVALDELSVKYDEIKGDLTK